MSKVDDHPHIFDWVEILAGIYAWVCECGAVTK
jgi:hypothetical protein